jgi:ABC-type polysaccharide/polyol phosphate export permease
VRQGGRIASTLTAYYNRLLDYWQHGYLLQNLVAREIKVRYRRSALGVVWTLLNPLMMMAIFTVVFSTLFARSLANFPVYFLSAHMSWHFFAQTTTVAMTSMVRSAALYKRIYVPKHIFVLAVIVSDSVNFLLSLLPLALLVIILRHPITPAILFLPVGFLILVGVTTGVSFVVATITVFFDDLTQFYQVILQAVMYLTALFYPLSIVPPGWRLLIRLNPMYHVIQVIRVPIYDGVLPPLESVVFATLTAVVSLVFGWLFFSRNSDRFVYYV